MIEHEKKIRLTEEEYHYLMRYIGNCLPTVRQVNHYFDTDDFSMNQKGVTCRIREKNGVLKATYKDHRQGKAFCSKEISCCVSNGLTDNDFTDMGLQYQGCLETYRTVILKQSFCTMVLDRNEYFGMTDYELEAEYTEGYEDRVTDCIRELFEFLGFIEKSDGFAPINVRIAQSKSKSERFFERKSCLQLQTKSEA